ncbi:polysaccharide pyruvyl transferase family protein [Klebsiella pneumoniae]|nr:polysaccharide pyruvyl transferase family protein [Klebsiella pneumoniae]
MYYNDKFLNKFRWKYISLRNRYFKLPKVPEGKNVAYVLGVSNHPNAGDQEITLAQKKIIEKLLPNYVYIEVEKEVVPKVIQDIRNNIKSGDIVFLQGGGTFSNLYPEHEKPRELILKKLRDIPCPIVQFPVSFYFEDMESFRSIKDVYNNAHNLILFARESKSFEILKSELTIPVYHVPDIVLSQNETKKKKRSGDILIMFRRDKECILPVSLGSEIIHEFSKISNLIITDNYVKNFVPTTKNNREKLLSNKFSEFNNASLIITDRLHGMIFAYITKTPAIVFDNTYGKVKYSYLDWLSNCEYIKLLDANTVSTQDVLDAYDALKSVNTEFSIDVDLVFKDLFSIINLNKI